MVGQHRPCTSRGELTIAETLRDTATQDPLVALGNVIENLEPALYVFKDFHPFLKIQNISIVRRLREIASSLKNTYKTIIIVSPMLDMLPELEKDITLVDFDLPTINDFSALLGRITEEVKDNPKLNVKVDSKTREQITHSLLGLTLSEAEKCFGQNPGSEPQSRQHKLGGNQQREKANNSQKRSIRIL